jgi:F-type H+-transporting ATPase subunit alpha
LDLSQYRELEAFAAFGSDLDPTSRAALERGSRLVELLKQPQFSPVPVEEQVVSIFLGTRGYLDPVPVEDVSRFESEFRDHLRRNHEGILTEIRESGQLTDDTAERLVKAIEEFTQQFTTSAGEPVVKEAKAEAIDEDETTRESVKVNRPAPAKK